MSKIDDCIRDSLSPSKMAIFEGDGSEVIENLSQIFRKLITEWDRHKNKIPCKISFPKKN